MSVKIIQPGALTTVQDLGRFGYQESGMQPCGVMDQRSYEIANTLVGNYSGEAVLELSLFGGSYQFDSPCDGQPFHQFKMPDRRFLRPGASGWRRTAGWKRRFRI